jgi:hypothetical protein
VYTDFKILEVKVPVIFSGTKGFPPRRDGRYGGSGSWRQDFPGGSHMWRCCATIGGGTKEDLDFGSWNFPGWRLSKVERRGTCF